MQNISSSTELWAVYYRNQDGTLTDVEITSDVPSTVARLEAMDFIITDILDVG